MAATIIDSSSSSLSPHHVVCDYRAENTIRLSPDDIQRLYHASKVTVCCILINDNPYLYWHCKRTDKTYGLTSFFICASCPTLATPKMPGAHPFSEWDRKQYIETHIRNKHVAISYTCPHCSWSEETNQYGMNHHKVACQRSILAMKPAAPVGIHSVTNPIINIINNSGNNNDNPGVENVQHALAAGDDGDNGSDTDEERAYAELCRGPNNGSDIDPSDDDEGDAGDSKRDDHKAERPTKTITIHRPEYMEPLFERKWFYMVQRAAVNTDYNIIAPLQCSAYHSGSLPCRIVRNGYDTRLVHHKPLPYSITYPIYRCTRHRTKDGNDTRGRGLYVHYFMASSQTWPAHVVRSEEVFAIGSKNGDERAQLVSGAFWNDIIALLNEEPNYRRVERLVRSRYLTQSNLLDERRTCNLDLGIEKEKIFEQDKHFKYDMLLKLFRNTIRRGLSISIIQRIHDHWWATQGVSEWHANVNRLLAQSNHSISLDTTYKFGKRAYTTMLRAPIIETSFPWHGEITQVCRVHLHGEGLGESADDVVSIIAGSGTLPAHKWKLVEWKSNKHIVCDTTILPQNVYEWKDKTHHIFQPLDIIIATKTGGRGSSLIKWQWTCRDLRIIIKPTTGPVMDPPTVASSNKYQKKWKKQKSKVTCHVSSIMNQDNFVIQSGLVPSDEFKYVGPQLDAVFKNTIAPDDIKVIHTDHVIKFQNGLLDAWRTAIDAKWPLYRQTNGLTTPEPDIAQDLYHAKGRIVTHMKQKHRDFAVALAELTDIFRRMANGTMAKQAKEIFEAKHQCRNFRIVSGTIWKSKTYCPYMDLLAALWTRNLMFFGEKWSKLSDSLVLTPTHFVMAAKENAIKLLPVLRMNVRQPLPPPIDDDDGDDASDSDVDHEEVKEAKSSLQEDLDDEVDISPTDKIIYPSEPHEPVRTRKEYKEKKPIDIDDIDNDKGVQVSIRGGVVDKLAIEAIKRLFDPDLPTLKAMLLVHLYPQWSMGTNRNEAWHRFLNSRMKAVPGTCDINRVNMQLQLAQLTWNLRRQYEIKTKEVKAENRRKRVHRHHHDTDLSFTNQYKRWPTVVLPMAMNQCYITCTSIRPWQSGHDIAAAGWKVKAIHKTWSRSEKEQLATAVAAYGDPAAMTLIGGEHIYSNTYLWICNYGMQGQRSVAECRAAIKKLKAGVPF